MDVATKLLEEIDHPPRGGISLQTLRQFLQVCREGNLRLPSQVARCCIEVIARHKNFISEDEFWTVHEQGALACLDCGLLSEGEALARKLSQRFPKSFRVKKLTGMVLEAQGKFPDAEALYDSILKEDPLNLAVRHRKAAIAKARGGPAEAISVLTKHLETYMQDQDAWEELADCYLQCLMYKQAAFCLEELLLLSPGSFHVLCRYADVLYSIGGRENYIAARKYYSRAVEISGGSSARALYGIVACQAQLDSPAGKGAALEIETNAAAAAELGQTAARALLEAYRISGATDECTRLAKRVLQERCGMSL